MKPQKVKLIEYDSNGKRIENLKREILIEKIEPSVEIHMKMYSYSFVVEDFTPKSKKKKPHPKDKNKTPKLKAKPKKKKPTTYVWTPPDNISLETLASQFVNGK